MKKYLVYPMAAAYILAGFNHFFNPQFYIKMISGMLPYPGVLVYISAVAEILVGIGLCLPATRRIAAIALIALLIAVFPANINMALHASYWNISPVGLYLRLPLQLLLIYWAYLYTKKENAETA